jgi:hypothetical protein
MLRNLRAPANPSAPEAQAVCDRCGFIYAHPELRWQYEWRGNALTNLRRLVCGPCLDVPQEQLRPRYLPPDPVPIKDPRPPFWLKQEGPAPANTPVYLLVPDND